MTIPTAKVTTRTLWIWLVIMALAAGLAYANTFSVPFLLDDLHNIIENPSIRSLWPPWTALRPPELSGVNGRPIVNFTLALNYAISGEDVWSYHLFNLLIHLMAGLTLWGIVRRTLARTSLAHRPDNASDILAFLIALIWLLHPLNTSAVTYLSQRCESLMGLFFLLTLYCAIRGWQAVQAPEALTNPRAVYETASKRKKSLSSKKKPSPVISTERHQPRREISLMPQIEISPCGRNDINGMFPHDVTPRAVGSGIPKRQLPAVVSTDHKLITESSFRRRPESRLIEFNTEFNTGPRIKSGVTLPGAVSGDQDPRRDQESDRPDKKNAGQGGSIRSAGSQQPGRPSGSNWWSTGAILACLAGVGTKEVIVVAPIVVLLYDRIFIHKNIREALRQSRGLYAGLAFSWVVLGLLVVSGQKLSDRWMEANYSSWEQLVTQPQVILHYIRLAFWPSPLCFDYWWPPARSAAEIWPSALAIILLVSIVLVTLKRYPEWGFPGACFFLILAPSSSIVPQPDFAFEYRIYLPLAALVALVVLGGYAGLRWRTERSSTPATGHPALIQAGGLALAVIVALGLGTATFVRNRDYQSELSIWSDTVNKRPHNHRAYNALGHARLQKQDLPEAINLFRKTVKLKPDYALGQCNLGAALAESGQLPQAREHIQECLRLHPHNPQGNTAMGTLLLKMGQPEAAVPFLREALEIKPLSAEAHSSLGTALAGLNQLDQAIPHFRAAVTLKPTALRHYNLGLALSQTGRLEEAVTHLKAALSLDPSYAPATEALRDTTGPKQ